MSGWMDEWMVDDGWMDGWVGVWMMDGWREGWMDWWVGARVRACVDDGRKDGGMGG